MVIDLNSGLDAETFEKYVRKLIEVKDLGSINYVSTKNQSTGGAPSVNRPKIEDYIRRTGNLTGERYTTEEFAEDLEINPQAVAKWLRRMTKEGFFKRHFKAGPGSKVEWELIRQVPEVETGATD